MTAPTIHPKALFDTLRPHMMIGEVWKLCPVAIVELYEYGVYTIPPRLTVTGFPVTIWLKDVRENR
ncbi:MAG: hypothetical protein IMZ55_10295 [Acidobacteria bacterium]|nr:hypothetical protein [Acidobacteriota bacterium]